MTQRLALIGFGVVGQGLSEILLQKENELKNRYGFEAKTVAICDLKKGSVYDPGGIDLQEALRLVRETGSLEAYPDGMGVVKGWDSLQTIRESNADTIVEVTYTDETGQPAVDHCKAAFTSGKNVVTTNKGPAALYYHQLSRLAKENGVRWGIEGTVLSGTPALAMPHQLLRGNDILKISGIFNGTTNFILTKMEEDGLSYEEALALAQEKGYAEANPEGDVEGKDALYKVVILANHLLRHPLSIEDVPCQGITGITREMIEEAQAEGKRWKLLARLEKKDGVFQAAVGPEKISVTDPLAAVRGATNAITYECDLLGPITLTGAGAGKTETGYALLADLLALEANQNKENIAL